MTVDREQLQRRLQWQQDEDGGDPFGLQEQVLALLAELEQAEETTDAAIHQIGKAGEAAFALNHRLEARLAKVPALVEALKEVTAHAEASDYDAWNSRGLSTDPGYGEPDEITKRALAVLADWESE